MLITNNTESETEYKQPSGASQTDLTPVSEHAQSPIEQPVQSPLSKREMRLLVRNLGSKDPYNRRQGITKLQGLSVSNLIAVVAYERASKRKFLVTAVPALCLLALISPLLQHFFHTHVSFIGIFPGLLVGYRGLVSSHKTSVVTLASLEHQSSACELIAALAIDDNEVQAAIQPALMKVLPQLRASDSNSIDAAARKAMLKFLLALDGYEPVALRRRPVPELHLACLEALKQIGDETFIPLVSRWSNSEGWGARSDIRDAAADCLPYLEQTIMNRKASSELVRASEASTSGGADVLVRPVSSPADLHEAELLRSSNLER